MHPGANSLSQRMRHQVYNRDRHVHELFRIPNRRCGQISYRPVATAQGQSHPVSGRPRDRGRLPLLLDQRLCPELLEEKPTGVYEDDGPFRDNIILISKVLDVRMRKSGRGDRSPTVRLGTKKVRCFWDHHRGTPNLLDDSLYVWQSLDVIELRRAFVSNDTVEFFLCSGLHIGEIHEGKNECLQERGRGIGPSFN